MAKTAKPKIPHARKLWVTESGPRKFLHVETDLPYHPSTPRIQWTGTRRNEKRGRKAR